MLRQSARGLRASLRNSDALSKALADEFSLTGSISARGTRPVASHGENIAKYHSITSQCKFEGHGALNGDFYGALKGSVLGFRRDLPGCRLPTQASGLPIGRGFKTSDIGVHKLDVLEVPPLGAESISEGTVGTILKQPGDVVVEDDVIAQLETDKVTIDIKYQKNIPGTIKAIHFAEGDTVEVGQAFADIEETPDATIHSESGSSSVDDTSDSSKESQPQTPSASSETRAEKPKVNKIMPPAAEVAKQSATPTQQQGDRPERRVKMTRLRKRIAERLKGAQNTYAMLTTFNEVDMTNLMEMRNKYKEEFLESHGVKLGFMSAFVKASANALQYVPAVNGVIEEEDILYRDYYDVSVAVSTPKGLVVPVLRNVDSMSFSDVEKTINDLGRKARDGTLSIDEMAGGTFTISNGGVFGSLMGTPIINPPQSAILGMHATKMRPAVVDGQVVARPMMYLALTYDHRLVDGREAVTFLKRIKEIIEDPRRLLLDV